MCRIDERRHEQTNILLKQDVEYDVEYDGTNA